MLHRILYVHMHMYTLHQNAGKADTHTHLLGNQLYLHWIFSMRCSLSKNCSSSQLEGTCSTTDTHRHPFECSLLAAHRPHPLSSLDAPSSTLIITGGGGGGGPLLKYENGWKIPLIQLLCSICITWTVSKSVKANPSVVYRSN